MIWDFSLPVQATITLLLVGKRASPKLQISCSGGNPTSLYVCRASREVALKRYRLSLGSEKVYANLKDPGCDILYFGKSPGIDNSIPGLLMRYSKSLKTNDPAQLTVNEIRHAERIALCSVDRASFVAYGGFAHCGKQMREKLSKLFVNLKEVLLSGGGTDHGTCCRRGTVIVEVLSDLDEEEARGRSVEWRDSREMRPWAQTMADAFDTGGLTDKEKMDGIPKAVVAMASRLLLHPMAIVQVPKVCLAYSSSSLLLPNL